MDKYQSRELLDFMRALKVTSEGTMLINALDDEIPQISEYFTPHFALTKLALHFKGVLDGGRYFEGVDSVETSEGILVLRRSTLKYTNTKVYKLIQGIYLEGMATLYALDINPALLSLITREDMLQIHNNINYAIEMLTDLGEQYYDTVRNLRLMDMDIMYVQSRVRGETNAL